jgi:hypothetical protein
MVIAVVAVGMFVLPASAPPSEGDNWRRLQSMPRELRTMLAQRLEQFDRLDRVERDAVRALDAKIAAEPDENRAAYFDVLRRYHLWFRTLTDTQRADLSAAPPENKLALVTKFRSDQRKMTAGSDSHFLEVADYGGVSPFKLASLIKIWLNVPSKSRDELKPLPELEQVRRLERLGTHYLIAAIPGPTAEQTEKLYNLAKKSRIIPLAKKAEETTKAGDRIKRRLADHYYFREHVPEKVKPERLAAFESALPSWVRRGFDPLPPEEARRRLTVLYRLVFPAGQEFDLRKAQTAAAAPSASPTSPSPRPSASGKSGGPF